MKKTAILFSLFLLGCAHGTRPETVNTEQRVREQGRVPICEPIRTSRTETRKLCH